MNVKKTIAGIASYALVGALAVGGTLAYLADTDSDLNAMTLGNVKIKQLEYERAVNPDGTYVTNENGYVLTEFTQFKTLIPATGGYSGAADNKWDDVVVPFDQIGGAGNMQMLDNNANAQDKLVVVKNTGITDAYVRTIIAYEVGSKSMEEWDKIVMTCKHNFWDGDYVGVANIDGNNYVIAEYTYQNPLKAGEVSRNSLSQVYLMPETTQADIDALDGNDNGLYDILVVSQAVQYDSKFTNVEMLDKGFGDTTITNHPWAGAEVSVEDEAKLVGATGSVMVNEDIELKDATTTLTQPVKIINNGTIKANRSDESGADKLSALTINSEVTLDGTGTLQNEGGYTISMRDDAAKLVINGGTYIGETSVVNVVKGDLLITGGTFIDTSDGGATYKNGHYLINCIDANYKNGSAKVEITGGTFKNWNPANNASEGAGTDFVPDGYKVTSTTDENGDVWYTVEAE